LVRLGKVTQEDAAVELDAVNDAVAKLHHQLSMLDSSRSEAREYAGMLDRAEAFVTRIAKGVDRGIVDLNNQDHQRRVVDALLHGIDVKTIGDGRERRVALTFMWIAQDPWGLADPTESMDITCDADGFPMLEEPPKSGVLMSRLSAVLGGATSCSTSWTSHRTLAVA
jgi:hypothetical protein